MIPGLFNPMLASGADPMLFAGSFAYTNPSSLGTHTISLPGDRQSGDKAFLFAAHPGFHNLIATPSGWTRRWYAGPASNAAYTARMYCWEYTAGGAPPASVSISTPDVVSVEAVTLLYRPFGLATVSAPHGTTYPAGPTMTAPSVPASAELVFGFDIRAYCSRESGLHQTLSGFDEIVRNLDNNGTRKMSIFHKQIAVGGALGSQSVLCDAPSGNWVAGTVAIGVTG
ncbi:MAG: hypothetical protein ACK4MV_07240 [Beijerinckiaceae bacterium]